MVLVPVHKLAAWQPAGRLLAKISEKRRSRGVKLPPNEFYVTELLRCPLQSWLDRVKPETETLEAMFVQAMGSAVHEMFRQAARELGWRVEERVETECTVTGGARLKITGRADIYDPEEKTVYEVKTVAPEDPSEARDRRDFILQAQFYYDVLRARRAVLILVSRSSGIVDVEDVTPREPGEARETLCRRAALLSRHLEERTPPKCVSGPWCGLCPYRYICPCAYGSWSTLEEYLRGER